MVLENILKSTGQCATALKHYALLALTSFAFSCGNCPGSSLSQAPCPDYQACGNYSEPGKEPAPERIKVVKGKGKVYTEEIPWIDSSRPGIPPSFLSLSQQPTERLLPTFGIDSDGGLNFAIYGEGTNINGKNLEDRCFRGQVPGVGITEGLIEVSCYGGDCFEFFLRTPLGVTCTDGKFVRDPASLTTSSAGILCRDDLQNQGQPSASSLGYVSRCPEGTQCQDSSCIGATISCQEIIPNHNDPAKARFNLIFVGSDYHLLNPGQHQEGLEAFLWDIKAILGENSKRGFFDFEPFKSNKNKFNLWYVDRFGIMEPLSEPYGFNEHLQRNYRGLLNARGIANKCIFDYQLNNAFTIHLVPNRGTLDSSIVIATTRETQLFDPTAYQSCQQALIQGISLLAGSDGCVDSLTISDHNPAIDYNGDGTLNSVDYLLFNQILYLQDHLDLCQSAPPFQEVVANVCSSGIDHLGRTLAHGSTLVHEVGHKFGAYDVLSGDYPPDQQWRGLTIANCFLADSEEDCRGHAPWKKMLGDGCGQPGIEDCAPHGLEVTCVEGCIYGIKSFRPARASTYAYGFSIPPGVVRVDELGPWMEWYTSQVMAGILALF